MIDLTGLFALGEGLARQAIATSGTRVRVGDVTKTVDPEKLTEVEEFTELWAEDAIVTVVGERSLATVAPGLDVRMNDWKIITYPELTPPAPKQVVKVLQSRDPNLWNREATVIGHTVTSAGAILTIYARP